MRAVITAIILFVFSNALAQSSFFNLGKYTFYVEELSNTRYELTIEELNLKLTVRDFKPVGRSSYGYYTDLYVVNADSSKLGHYSINPDGKLASEKLNAKVEGRLNVSRVPMRGPSFDGIVNVIIYETLKGAGDTPSEIYYEKLLHFKNPIDDQYFLHTYLDTTPKNIFNSIVEKSSQGEEIHYFKTGDSMMLSPGSPNSPLLPIKPAQNIMLPAPPKRIKDFKVIKRQDLSEEEIAKAKEYVGSKDFRNIMENYSEGSVAILGESGEGKTYIAKQFYVAALAGLIPNFQIQEVLLLTKSSLSKDTKYVGQASEKLDALLTYYQQGQGKRLIFADEVHTLKGAGTSSNNPSDHLQSLKSEMGDGTFKMIATTTSDEFNALVGADTALERRFLKFSIQKKTHKEVMAAVRYNAKIRDIEISDELIEKIIFYSDEFDVAGKQPAKAIKLVAKSIAKHKIDYHGQVILEEQAVINSIADLYNSDPKMLDPEYTFEKVKEIREVLDKKVIGHEHVKDALITSITNEALGLNETGKPPMRVLLIGPPGTGKSYSPQIFGEALGANVETVSLNNYAGHHNADKFLNDMAGLIKKYPNGVFIFDEFEKASLQVQLSTLQMFNDGEFSVNLKMAGSEITRKMTISTKRVRFALTSNVGDEEILKLFKDILQVEMEKTQDLEKASAAAKKVFAKMTSKEKLKKLLKDKNFNTAVTDRMDYILAVPPSNPIEFRQVLSLSINKVIKDYKRSRGINLNFTNREEILDALMTHYKPGLSNRDAENISEELKVSLRKMITPKDFKKEKLSLKIDTKDILFVDDSNKTTENLKKLITMHELHGHWLVNFMLYGENVSNYVTIVPGDGYLGYVRPKINWNLTTETMETFTGMFKKAIVLEAGYRAERILGGIHGRGAGAINREAGKAPSDDLGRINQLFEQWINNNFFEDIVTELHSSTDKQKFKLEMKKIITLVTDFVIKKGVAEGIGAEAVEKIRKEGKLHAEYLDDYADRLNKKINYTPTELLEQALEYAKENLGSHKRVGIGFRAQKVSNSSVTKILDKVIRSLKSEKPFFNGKCNSLYN